MKAKFIALNGAMCLILANKEVYNSEAKESKPKFLKRVQTAAGTELEVEELTASSFSKLTPEQLTKAASKETGLLADLLNLAASKKAPKVEKPVKEAKVKAEKPAKVVKERTPKMTEKEALELVEASKINIGHTISFTPHLTAVRVEGVIRGVWADLRVPMVYYRIYDADGKLYNKAVNLGGLEIGELAPDTKAEEKAAKEKEKADAKAAKEAEKAEKAKKIQAIKDAAKKAKELDKASKAKAKEEAIQKSLDGKETV